MSVFDVVLYAESTVLWENDNWMVVQRFDCMTEESTYLVESMYSFEPEPTSSTVLGDDVRSHIQIFYEVEYGLPLIYIKVENASLSSNIDYTEDYTQRRLTTRSKWDKTLIDPTVLISNVDKPNIMWFPAITLKNTFKLMEVSDTVMIEYPWHDDSPNGGLGCLIGVL